MKYELFCTERARKTFDAAIRKRFGAYGGMRRLAALSGVDETYLSKMRAGYTPQEHHTKHGRVLEALLLNGVERHLVLDYAEACGLLPRRARLLLEEACAPLDALLPGLGVEWVLATPQSRREALKAAVDGMTRMERFKKQIKTGG